MFERFTEWVRRVRGPAEDEANLRDQLTDRGRRVLDLAQDEARLLGHSYIGTEHLLLGLIREEDGVAAQVLVRLGADLKQVRQQVIELISG